MGDIIRKKKNGRDLGWYIRWTENGKRRQLASHQPTYALAKRMLLEIEARVARGMVGIIEPDVCQQISVAELCERFIEEYSSPKLKDPTRYRQFAASRLRRVLPYIGQVQLGELSKAHVIKARDALARKHPPGTTRTTLIPLMAALSWGVRQGLLDQNPALGIERPASPNAQLEFLSADEVKRLLAEAARRAQVETGAAGLLWRSRHVAVLLAVYTGMRKGEVFGLRWQDVNLEAERLTIAHSYESSPKNGRVRHLRLPTAVVPVLRQWLEQCPKTSRGLVCPIWDRGSWHMSMSTSKTHGLPELLRNAHCQAHSRCWHLLRHTFASHYMMAGGSLLALSKILGHSSLNVTMIYAHLAPDYLDREMERVKF